MSETEDIFTAYLRSRVIAEPQRTPNVTPHPQSNADPKQNVTIETILEELEALYNGTPSSSQRVGIASTIRLLKLKRGVLVK